MKKIHASIIISTRGHCMHRSYISGFHLAGNTEIHHSTVIDVSECQANVDRLSLPLSLQAGIPLEVNGQLFRYKER